MTTDLKNVRLPLMVSEPELTAIDDWRFSRRVPTRAEAIRRLIHLGIKAEPILRDLLRLLERLQWDDEAAELDKHIADIKEALGL
ncbi:hypothetical protein ACXIUS_29690 [Bosea thiooxidans]